MNNIFSGCLALTIRLGEIVENKSSSFLLVVLEPCVSWHTSADILLRQPRVAVYPNKIIWSGEMGGGAELLFFICLFCVFVGLFLNKNLWDLCGVVSILAVDFYFYSSAFISFPFLILITVKYEYRDFCQILISAYLNEVLRVKSLSRCEEVSMLSWEVQDCHLDQPESKGKRNKPSPVPVCVRLWVWMNWDQHLQVFHVLPKGFVLTCA